MIECVACGTSFDAAGAVRFRKDGFDVVRCPTCGLLVRAVLPTAAELDEIYGSAYFFSGEGDTHGQGYADYLAEEEVHRDSARRRLRVLEEHVPPGVLLDVGAAAGFFVDEARRRGWNASGIDISDGMAAWGRDHLGVPVETASLAAVDANPATLDALTMWDYIEHSLDPLGELTRAAELVRPGGILALSTGDAASLAARVSGSRWHLLTPRHHNFFFTADTLRRLLGRTGFDVVQLGHPGARYSLAYLAHKARTLADVSPLRAVAGVLADRQLGRLAVPVNLFDIVSVYARRR